MGDNVKRFALLHAPHNTCKQIVFCVPKYSGFFKCKCGTLTNTECSRMLKNFYLAKTTRYRHIFWLCRYPLVASPIKKPLHATETSLKACAQFIGCTRDDGGASMLGSLSVDEFEKCIKYKSFHHGINVKRVFQR